MSQVAFPLPLAEEPRAPEAPDVPGRLRIGPLEVDRVTFAEALMRIEQLVDGGRGGAVFTPNVDHVVKAERDPAFRAAYGRAELCLADGMPLLWASRILGSPLPAKVSGSDLLLPLARTAAERGWRTFLVGGGQGVAEAAAEKLRRELGVSIAGVASPAVDARGVAEDEPMLLERIRASKPDLVLVAFGAPKQELWIDRHVEALSPAVAMGVGGSLDFLTGRVRRAPKWMSEAGLEWLFRLGREPRRLWRRYLVDDPAFLAIVARSRVAPVPPEAVGLPVAPRPR